MPRASGGSGQSVRSWGEKARSRPRRLVGHGTLWTVDREGADVFGGDCVLAIAGSGTI